MHHPETAPTRRGIALRWIGFIVAVGLGGVSVWLVTMGDSTRHIQLGVLAGLWAALLAAFAMFGSRRHLHPSEPEDAADARPGSALELRMAATELERAEEAAARRAHEARLEHLLRREIQTTVTRELAALRDEITQLRSEIVEKVDGRLRLERIETTRVIGSDLEALQHEVRQLKQVTGQDELLARPRVTEPLRQIVEPARVRPVTRQTAEVEATVQPARQSDAVQHPAAASDPAPMPPDATAPIRMTPVPRPAAPAPAPDPAPPDAGEAPAPPVRPAASEAPRPPVPAPQPEASEPPTPQPPPAARATPAAASATPAAASGTPEVPQPAAAALQPAPPAPDVPPVRQPSAGIPRADAPPVPRLRGVPLGEIPLPPTVVPVIVTAEPLRPPDTPSAAESARPNEPTKPAEAARAPDPSGDFAGLPRIRPFTDFELDPIIEPPRETPPQRTHGNLAPDADDEPDYTGRRRRGDEAEAPGRHAHRPEPAGRRHRQPDDDPADGQENGHDTGHDTGHDLLARLLSRESR